MSERECIPATELPVVDRYRAVRELGRGGMGVVYEAHDERLNRRVALKLLPGCDLDTPLRERFLQEARAAAALNHPNIVAVHDAGEHDGRPWLVMELVEGKSLDRRPPQTIEETLRVAAAICDALEHAHERGLVHRDLKPGNVIAAGETVKLTDMGIALARGATRVTQSGAITGTPGYMAPEQALGQPIDGRADLYALGVMLYQWACGRLPFDGDDALAIVSQHIHAPLVPPRAFCCELPPGLEPLIVRLLAKDPTDRFADAREVREALAAVGSAEAEPVERQVTIEGLARGHLIGRQGELGQLQELWRAALDGRSGLALISGEPGIGKSRLARELTATARLDGARVLFGGCYENEATTPYLPFVEALRRWVGEHDDEALRARLGDGAAELARLAPEIDSRLGPFAERTPLEPAEQRLRLFDHVARFLRELAAERGLLFFLDDLQWADHGSLGLLHYLLRQLPDERLLFVGTYREVELDRAHPLSRALVDWDRERMATRVRLDRLGRRETERMVTTLLGNAEISGEFVGALHEETEGNPFFVEEMLKALIARGGLVHDGRAWGRGDGETLTLPQSVKAAIGSRLERVSDRCNETLRVAAVLGKQFAFAELATVGGLDDDALLDLLDEAVQAQLIAAGSGESFAFTHDKIREVLYEELNPIRRRRTHARIAEGLERLDAGGRSIAVEELAHHSIESGDCDKGIVYAERAARAALDVFAYDEALEMFSRARECAEELERPAEVTRFEEAMGRAAHDAGHISRAAEHLERALARTTDAEHRIELRCELANAYAIAGDPRGVEHVRRASARVDAELQPDLALHAMTLEARYLHLAGRFEEAAAIFARGTEIAATTDDRELAVRFWAYYSGTLQHLARFDESDRTARRCIELEVPNGQTVGYEFLSENAFYRARWDESIAHGEREEALAREFHAGDRLAWSLFRAFAMHMQGRLGEAHELAERGLTLAARNGDRRLELFFMMLGASYLAETGKFDEALELAERAVAAADEANLVGHRVTGREHLVRVLLCRGESERALAIAREALKLCSEHASAGVALIAGSLFAEALVRGGALDEAERALDEHLELARSTDSAGRIALNDRVRSLLAGARGESRAALEHADRAVAGLEKGGTRLILAELLAERASLLRDGAAPDRSGEAAGDLRRARKLLREAGAVPQWLTTES